MSWAPEVFVEGKWSRNALRFATKEEAESSATALLMRWYVPTDARATEAEEPVNYRIVDGRQERVPSDHERWIAEREKLLEEMANMPAAGNHQWAVRSERVDELDLLIEQSKPA